MPLVKAEYILPAHCNNCGWNGTQKFDHGIVARETERLCPHCGCATLRYGDSIDFKIPANSKD